MPTYEISAPNGRTYQIDGPEGASQDQIQAEVTKQYPDASGTATPSPGMPEATIAAPTNLRGRVEARKRQGSVMPFTTEAVSSGINALAPYIPLPAPASQALQTSDVGKVVVPQTYRQVGETVGTLGANRYVAPLTRFPGLARIFGGAAGGGAGAAVGGESIPRGIAEGGGGAAAGEALGLGGRVLPRIVPGAKGRINEGVARETAAALQQINPAAGPAIENAVVSPELRGGDTAAAIKRAIESGAMQEGASQRYGQALSGVASQAHNPRLNTPALKQAYSMMPTLAQDKLVGPIGPGGMTLEQATAVRSWLGGPAFSQSPLGQGVGKIPQQQLWADITRDIENGVSVQAMAPNPQAIGNWQTANKEYGGLEALMEALSGGNAFQGQPNRIFLNRSALSDYLAKNEQDITRRLGSPEAYNDFVNQVMSGGQAGTRDYLAPGGGGMFDSLMGMLRGTNTGAIQAARLPITTAVPNVGSQYTGRQPYGIPRALQTILDLAGQKGAGAVP